MTKNNNTRPMTREERQDAGEFIAEQFKQSSNGMPDVIWADSGNQWWSSDILKRIRPLTSYTRTDLLEQLLPPTFYASLPLQIRIEMMVKVWQSALLTCEKMQEEKDLLEQRVKIAAEKIYNQQNNGLPMEQDELLAAILDTLKVETK